MFVSSEVSCSFFLFLCGVLNPGVVVPHVSFRGEF